MLCQLRIVVINKIPGTTTGTGHSVFEVLLGLQKAAEIEFFWGRIFWKFICLEEQQDAL